VLKNAIMRYEYTFLFARSIQLGALPVLNDTYNQGMSLKGTRYLQPSIQLIYLAGNFTNISRTVHEATQVEISLINASVREDSSSEIARIPVAK